ncbi:MAG: ISNCY family transposase, partial [Kiritimatiellia bacterium]|nr:ISNCY family transposase [Kiritimatiellia bacterium]
AAMNILAFLFHSFMTFCDESYRLIRAALPTRKTFFEHIRTLTYYINFASWAAMMDFMMRGLEIGPYEVK